MIGKSKLCFVEVGMIFGLAGLLVKENEKFIISP